jgi:oligoendopeptidase F
VKEFLSSGTSKSPKEIFLGLGLDITNKNFWEDGLAEIESQIQITEQLAIKLGKI